MNRTKEYYKKLDYLRIISCILVLLYHLNILKGGFLAVCTFFALSGYLECFTALKKDNFSIKEYYISRFKRIYYPLLIVVFSTIILFKINEFTNWMNLKPETLSVLFNYNNFWQLHANLDYFTRNVNSPFTHFWYISILIQFEIIFPIVYLIIKKIDIKLRKDISTPIVLILTIASTVLFLIMSFKQDKMIVYYNTFARSFSILFGILLALLHYNYNFKISRKFKGFKNIIFVLYCILLIVLCIFISDKSDNYGIYMILTTIISLRIIEYSTIEKKLIVRENQFIQSLAKLSYGIYLIQYPVIFFFSRNPMENNIKIPLIIIITFILSYLLNFLTNNIKFKKSKIICLIIIIIIGCGILIAQKDYSDEMKELEEKLNENQKISDEQKSKFLNSSNIETEKEEQQEDIQEMTVEEQKNRISEKVKNLPIVGIGDSVLLGAADELYKIFPNSYFDGKVSRTVEKGRELLQELKDQGKLGDVVVLVLANNGDYSDYKHEKLMEVLENREVFWIDSIGADDPNYNEQFENFAKNYPNIHIIKWTDIGEKHPEYFYADGVHIKEQYAIIYANMIYDEIYNYYWNQYNLEK